MNPRIPNLLLLIFCSCASPAGRTAVGEGEGGEGAAGAHGAEAVPSSAAAPVGRSTEGPDDAAVARFAGVLNERRLAAGCPSLEWDDEVEAVALAHSRDMVERRYFAHVSPDGRDPFGRLRSAKIQFVAAAENIAYGQVGGDDVFSQWEASEAHRQNMMECVYTRHGVGRFGAHWTQVLFRPAGVDDEEAQGRWGTAGSL